MALPLHYPPISGRDPWLRSLLALACGMLLGAVVLFDYAGTLALMVALLALPGIILTSTIYVDAWQKLTGLFKQLQWWHFLWLAIFASAFVFRVRDAAAARSNPLDLWALYRIGLMGLVGFVLFIRLAMKHPDWLPSYFRGLVGLLGFAALWNLISTLWSVYPEWTLYKSIEYFLDIALLAAILTMIKTPEELKQWFDWSWVLITMLAGTVVLGAILWPDLSITPDIGTFGVRLIGVYPAVSANGVGDLGAILGCVCVARLLFGRSLNSPYSLLLIVAVGLLLIAQTRSALGGFLIGTMCIFVFTKRIGVMTVLGGGGLVAMIVAGADQLLLDYVLRGQTTELFMSGTGRLDWWGFAWDRFVEQPISGFGAYAAGRFAVLASAGFGETSTLHSSWLEVLLGVGLPGFLLLAAAFVGTWAKLIQSPFHYEYGSLAHRLTIEAIAVLAVLSVRSLFDSLLIWHPALPFFLVVGFAEILRQRRRTVLYENPAHS